MEGQVSDYGSTLASVAELREKDLADAEKVKWMQENAAGWDILRIHIERQIYAAEAKILKGIEDPKEYWEAVGRVKGLKYCLSQPDVIINRVNRHGGTQ